MVTKHKKNWEICIYLKTSGSHNGKNLGCDCKEGNGNCDFSRHPKQCPIFQTAENIRFKGIKKLLGKFAKFTSKDGSQSLNSITDTKGEKDNG